MLTFLQDAWFQGFALVAALGALGFVGWDLYEGVRDPSSSRRFAPFRRGATAAETPKARARVEASVETWTDSQGQICGRVRRGPCRGMRLEDLSREQCDAQAAYVREHDPASGPALDSFVRWRFGARRRYEAPTGAGMTRARAFAELGLREGASLADVHAAYRRLMKVHHPDHGGAQDRAARLNEAKDLLAETSGKPSAW